MADPSSAPGSSGAAGDSGRVALVTGAARGIGAATARLLAEQGHEVVLVDRCSEDPALAYAMATPAELDEVAAECGGLAVVGDVRFSADMTDAVAHAVDRFGGLDVVVAAAGVIAGGESLWELPDEEWQVLVDTNLTGVMHTARAGVPALLARPEPRAGRFVAISSAIALKASPKLAAYSASKAGVIGLVRGLAADLANTGITANVVQPGTTNTAVLAPSAEVYSLTDPAEFTQHQVDERILDPRELAEAITWLASPASSAVNGAVIPVDAGMTAR